MVILHSCSCKWITAPEPEEQNNFIWGLGVLWLLLWRWGKNYRLEINIFFSNFEKVLNLLPGNGYFSQRDEQVLYLQLSLL
jgi:hypothetical protein